MKGIPRDISKRTRFLIIFCILVLVGILIGVYFLISKDIPTPEIANPSFEEHLTGWVTTGFIEDEGHAKEDDIEPNIIRSQTVIGYRLNPEGQAQMLADVMTIMRAVPDGRGLGIFWWDATWTAVPGNGWEPSTPNSGNNWENQALFDFEDRPLPAMNLFSKP